MPVNTLPTELSRTLMHNKIVVFSKTNCPHSRGAKDLLDEMNVKHQDIELDERPDQDDYMQVLSGVTGRQTTPQVFVEGRFIGGGDELKSKKDTGELQDLFITTHAYTAE